MTQTRFHNYRRKLRSFEENQRFLGLTIPGVYSGFDRLEPISGTTVRIHHDISGIAPTDTDNTTVLNKRGVSVTKQGFFIYDDAPIDVEVSLNTGNAFTRIDYLIVTHQYLASVGGQSATYSILTGALGGPVEPSLTTPQLQVLLGKIYVPASAASHANTVFVKNAIPSLGGYSFNKLTESDINAVQNFALVNDFNAQVRSEIVYLGNNPINAPVSASRWTLLTMRSGSYITQLASNADNGKLYSRASTNGGSTWLPWVNMNNPDVVIDFQPITDQIGTRVYTEDNYVTDLQTVTQSIDALDIELKDTNDALGTTNTNVSNVSSAVGNRTYDDQHVLTNGESVTASLNKLDKSFKHYASGNLNTILVPGRYSINGGAVLNSPSGFGTTYILDVNTYTTDYKIQRAYYVGDLNPGPIVPSYGKVWVRTYQISTTTWGAWQQVSNAEHVDDNIKVRVKKFTFVLNLQTGGGSNAVILTGIDLEKFIGVTGNLMRNDTEDRVPLQSANGSTTLAASHCFARILYNISPAYLTFEYGTDFRTADYNAATLTLYVTYDGN